MAGRGSKRRRPRPHGVASERQALQPTRQYWTALKPWGRCWAMRSGPTGARDGGGARFRSTTEFADVTSPASSTVSTEVPSPPEPAVASGPQLAGRAGVGRTCDEGAKP